MKEIARLGWLSTFLPLMKDGRTRMVLADLVRVRVLLAATFMHAFLSHDCKS